MGRTILRVVSFLDGSASQDGCSATAKLDGANVIACTRINLIMASDKTSRRQHWRDSESKLLISNYAARFGMLKQIQRLIYIENAHIIDKQRDRV